MGRINFFCGPVLAIQEKEILEWGKPKIAINGLPQFGKETVFYLLKSLSALKRGTSLNFLRRYV